MSSVDVQSNEKIAIRVSLVTIIWNAALTVFKLFAGIVSGSGAMVSDAVHTASDVLSTLIVIAGVKMAYKESDSGHQYGHERFECAAAIILSVMLFIVGAGIGLAGTKKILGGAYDALEIPGVLALIAAVVSIVVKEAMYWYTIIAAKKINSGALKADAWHHRSDALSSIGSFVGILGARLGFPVLDPVASVIICVFIIKASVEIFLDAIGKLTDQACDENTANKIMNLIAAEEGVKGVDQLKTRLFGDKIYVDIEIKANGRLSLNEAHEIAQRVHDTVEKEFSNVKHCMVHVNPEN